MAGRRRSILALCLLTSCIVPTLAQASEDVVYRYDARGRLVKVERSGTVNNGITACYAYDKADNRTTVAVATAGCAPSPSFSIGDATITEGGNLIFTVTKTGSTSNSYTVNFTTANGSATSGSDYTANSGTLTFGPADTTQTITVGTIDDAAAENAETVLVNLSAASGAAPITDSQGIGTINDNDIAAPSLAIADSRGSEGPLQTITFVVTKSGTTTSNVSVNYATANWTATSVQDYVAQSGTLTFAPNETTKSIMVSLKDDNFHEGEEYFYVNLSSPSGGATISVGQAIGSIEDDESEALCAPPPDTESGGEAPASTGCGTSES